MRSRSTVAAAYAAVAAMFAASASVQALGVWSSAVKLDEVAGNNDLHQPTGG
jgi:hypothetical protein